MAGHIKTSVLILLLLSVVAWQVKTACAIDDYGLILYWNFDDETGSVVDDSSINDNDGTINGAEWATGRFNGGLDFDNGDTVIAETDPMHDLSELTVSFWIKHQTVTDVAQVVVSDYSDSPCILYVERYGVNGYKPHVVSDPSGWVTFQGLFNPSADDWNHVCVTWDRPYLRMYVNGTEDAASPSSVVNENLASTVVRSFIVGLDSYTGASFDGIIDDLRVYSRAFSVTEVEELYDLNVLLEDEQPTNLDLYETNVAVGLAALIGSILVAGVVVKRRT